VVSVTAERVCAGKVALVTGASKGGTGTAIAIRLAAAGAKVAITARTLEGLEETRRRIEGIGGECLVLPADLSDPDGGRETLVSRTESEIGPVDILVNSAHAAGRLLFDETTVETLELCLQMNLWAPWELMRAAVPGMRERGRGWILNLTSRAADHPPGPPFSAAMAGPGRGGFQYGASKAALNRLTTAAASECADHGIAVNALVPVAAIATPRLLAGGVLPSNLEILFEPLEVMAEAALVLCSGDPAILTGRIASSLHLLIEMNHPVFDLSGEHLVDGWQPSDLPAFIARQQALMAERGL
jgi:NAD(P)-dependent dehydrogenase (short-subunit alcohol dehydrogenase family)